MLTLFVILGGIASAANFRKTRLGYPGGDDWEPAVAADGSGHVYVLFPHYGGVPGCSACPSPTMLLQVSDDRGANWSSPKIVTPNSLGSSQVDGQIVVDPIDKTTVYAAWLQNKKSDTIIIQSTDQGQTWSSPVVADSTNAGTDKPILAVRGQDVYLGFTHAQKNSVAASHDGGKTFVSSLVQQNAKYSWSLAGGAAIDSKGNVYFGWAGYTQNGGAKGPVYLYITKSSDGGKSWSSKTLDVSGSPPDCSAFSCGWAYLGAQVVLTVDSNDTLYTLWNAGAVNAGPERIYFARSTDGGSTWSPRQDVSSAPPGTSHAFPALTTGGAGDIRIGWMDARNSGKWNLYYRTSKDSGSSNSWSGESQLSYYVSGYSYKSPNPNGFAFPYGDYWEMDVDDQSRTQAVWGEGPNYTGPGNIWYASQ